MTQLFSEPFFNLEDEIKRQCFDKINNTKKETFLSNDENKLIENFYEEFKLGGLEIGETISDGEEIQNSLNVHIPIIKGADLFVYRPQSSPCFWFSIRPPILNGAEILHNIRLLDTTPEQINKELEHIKSTIDGNIHNLNSDINKFNIQLKSLIEQKVKEKIKEIKKTSEVVSKLNIKLKKREDAPKTYILHIKKKKIVLSTSKIETENPFTLEPTLNINEYDNILDIIDNMAQVMERSPSAFVNMKEEDLRIHFLVQLNGQYEGEAMGEVFNLEGKTDILIRHKKENLFIAECKFWHGKKEFLEAIDQLLNYISWRDTKTAIILFNRNKNTSDVLKQIPEIIKEHPNYVKPEKYKRENSFRFIMKNKNDEEKTFVLTTKLFDIPKK